MRTSKTGSSGGTWKEKAPPVMRKVSSDSCFAILLAKNEGA
jgi:hypothetical protein